MCRRGGKPVTNRLSYVTAYNHFLPVIMNAVQRKHYMDRGIKEGKKDGPAGRSPNSEV
jgi:hypothetical protein